MKMIRKANPKVPAKKTTRGGLQKEYYGTGQLRNMGRYLNGKKTGLWKFYHRNGTAWAAGKFERGHWVGLWKWFADNGVVRQVGPFVKGKQDGLWKRYYGGTGKLYDMGENKLGKKGGMGNGDCRKL